MRSSTPTAETRAASAALARLQRPELDLDRIMLVDDSDEDATKILCVVREPTCPVGSMALEVHS